MSQESYRYYCLDGIVHLHGPEWFEAENDEDAIARVEAEHRDATYERWHGKHLAATLRPKRLCG